MSEAVDFELLRQGQQKTWAQGDFAMIANLVVMAAEQLAEALQLMAGERVLDVALRQRQRGAGGGASLLGQRGRGRLRPGAA